MRVADYAWSRGTCQPQPPEEYWYYGIPGSGTWGWTARFGTYWIGGAIFQLWAGQGYECGGLGPPVKAASSDFHLQWPGADEGQWFKGGAVVRIYGQWQIRLGDYGQYAGRLVEEESPQAESEGVMPDGDPPELLDEMSV
jgi:hypothetical protein